jgi:hypothetical protein
MATQRIRTITGFTSPGIDMSMLGILAALTLTVGVSAQDAPTQTVTLAGRKIEVSFKDAVPMDFDGDIDNWEGWGDLRGSIIPSIVVSRNSELAGAAPSSTAAVFRAKVIVYQRLELLHQAGDGALIRRRGDLEDPQLDALLADFALLRNQVAKLTQGAVDLRPDIEIRPEPYRTLGTGKSFNTTEILRELEVHGNGGTFDAEDKVFRGPYHVHIAVLPFSPEAGTPFTLLGNSWGRPAIGLGYYAPHSFRARLDLAFRQSVYGWLGRRGFAQWPAGDDWKRVLDQSEPSQDEYLRSMTQENGALEVPSSDGIEVGVRSPDMTVELVTDTERGKVLSILERNVGRSGGVSLSVPTGGIDTTKTPSLTFWAKQESLDPFAIWFNGSYAVSLGPDRLLGGESGKAVSFARNGTWQKVVIPIGNLKLEKINSISIQSSPNAALRGKIENRPPQIWLSDFKLGSESAAWSTENDAADSKVIEVASKGQLTEPEFLAWIASEDKDVVLNTITKAPKPFSPEVTAALVKQMSSIDPLVAQAAVRTYAEGMGAEGVAQLRQTLQFGLTDLARVEAAKQIAKGIDPKEAGYISILLGDRRANVRIGGLEALARLSGREAGIIRLAYITQQDPSVKCLVTSLADPADDYSMRKVLWSAVNEPWDAVRLLSRMKLAESPIEDFRKEGLAGVKDESVGVRISFVSFLAGKKNAQFRPALLQAILDSDSRVRGEALKGLVALGEIKPEEIAPLLTDTYPAVQFALIDAIIQKRISPGPDVLNRLKQSRYPAVRQAARELGES